MRGQTGASLDHQRPPAGPGADLGLDVLQADDGFLVLVRGLLVLALLEELVALAVQHRNRLQPLGVAQRPRLAAVLAGLLHLRSGEPVSPTAGGRGARSPRRLSP